MENMSRISQYLIVKEDVQLRRGDEDQGKFYFYFNNIIFIVETICYENNSFLGIYYNVSLTSIFR